MSLSSITEITDENKNLRAENTTLVKQLQSLFEKENQRLETENRLLIRENELLRKHIASDHKEWYDRVRSTNDFCVTCRNMNVYQHVTKPLCSFDTTSEISKKNQQ